MALDMISTQWQTIVAIAIAAACAAWVVWRLLRPFVGRVVDACRGDDESRVIQIEPAGTEDSDGGAVKTGPPSH